MEALSDVLHGCRLMETVGLGPSESPQRGNAAKPPCQLHQSPCIAIKPLSTEQQPHRHPKREEPT